MFDFLPLVVQNTILSIDEMDYKGISKMQPFPFSRWLGLVFLPEIDLEAYF